MRACVIQSLESRAMLAANLSFGTGNLNDTIFKPNDDVSFSFTFNNLGDADVSGPFRIGMRLVPYAFGKGGFDFSDINYDTPNFIEIGSTIFNGTVPALSAGITGGLIEGVIPANVPAGTYSLEIKADTEGVIAGSYTTGNVTSFLDVQVLTSAGVMVLTGTSDADVISLAPVDLAGEPSLQFTLSNRSPFYSLERIKGFKIDLLAGKDVFNITGSFSKVVINGGNGDDSLTGGDGGETLNGGKGKDTIHGNLGKDLIKGDAGNDKLFGEAGNDSIYGGAGNDSIQGGAGNDLLDGSAGIDSMYGQSGTDTFFARDHVADLIFGASGKDTLTGDIADILSSVETKFLA